MRKPICFRLQLQTVDALNELTKLFREQNEATSPNVSWKHDDRTWCLEKAVALALEVMQERARCGYKIKAPAEAPKKRRRKPAA